MSTDGSKGTVWGSDQNRQVNSPRRVGYCSTASKTSFAKRWDT